MDQGDIRQLIFFFPDRELGFVFFLVFFFFFLGREIVVCLESQEMDERKAWRYMRRKETETDFNLTV